MSRAEGWHVFQKSNQARIDKPYDKNESLKRLRLRSMVSRKLKTEDDEKEDLGETSPYKKTDSLDKLSRLKIVRVSTSKLHESPKDDEKEDLGETSPYKKTDSLDKLSRLKIVRVSTSKLHKSPKDTELDCPRAISYKKTDSLVQLHERSLVKASVSELQEANKDECDDAGYVSYKQKETLDKLSRHSIAKAISEFKDALRANSGDYSFEKEPSSPIELVYNNKFDASISGVQDIHSNPCIVTDTGHKCAAKADSRVNRPRVIMRKRLSGLHKTLTTLVSHICMPSQLGPDNNGYLLTG